MYREVVDDLMYALLDGEAQVVLTRLLFDEDVDLFYTALSDAMSRVMLIHGTITAPMAQAVRRFVRALQYEALDEARNARRALFLRKYSEIETVFGRNGVTAVDLLPIAI